MKAGSVDRQAYDRFSALRDGFRARVAEWSATLPGLADAQRRLAEATGDTGYAVETPIVYNRALDEVGPDDDIAWLVVADNPGKREQEAAMNRYLVGRSGQAAERFFARELGVDFRRRVVVVNKTPVHTPKTAQLRKLARIMPEARPVLEESQRYMASLVPELQACLGASVWVMGLSELRPKGLFETWRTALNEAYRRADADALARGLSAPSEGLYGFNHFSMGSFATDLKRRRALGEPVVDAVLRIGVENRTRLLDLSMDAAFL
jgi:hypothetical protein